MQRCREHEAGCRYKWLRETHFSVFDPDPGRHPPPAAFTVCKGLSCASCEAVGPEEEAGCSEVTRFTPTGLAGPPNTCESGARLHVETSDPRRCHLFLSLLFGKLALT